MSWQDFVDDWGVLDKKFMPDGGDSCHRMGMFFALIGMQKNISLADKHYYHITMGKLYKGNGIFVRHPNPKWDASDWDRMSRDQFKPMIMAAGYFSKSYLKDITIGHLKRGFLFTNNTRRNGATKNNHNTVVAGELRNYHWKLPDPTGPDIWANFIRAWNAWFLYPLLLIFDLEILASAIKWRYFPSHNIAMNYTLSVLHGLNKLPTPWIWLSAKIMPMEKCIQLIGEHFRDFPNDMIFFEDMFKEAYKKTQS